MVITLPRLAALLSIHCFAIHQTALSFLGGVGEGNRAVRRGRQMLKSELAGGCFWCFLAPP